MGEILPNTQNFIVIATKTIDTGDVQHITWFKSPY